MGPKVREHMTDRPRCVTPDTSVSEAAELMATEDVGSLPIVEGGILKGLKNEDVPLRNAMNEVLREEYVQDSQRGVDKWNGILRDAGIGDRLKLPSRRFHRRIGTFAGVWSDPEGRLITKEAFERQRDEWLPSAADQAYV